MYFTRITYNNNNWVSPSGTEGKSNNMSLFEAQSHFGFEEWTFDLTKIVDGFHYGFLQGFQKVNILGHPANQPIKLNTIHRIGNGANPHYWVGKINKWEYVNLNEGTVIQEIYEQNGWLDEMRAQLDIVGASIPHFNVDVVNPKLSIFNIKFKPEELELYNAPIEIDPDSLEYKKTRYQVYQY